MSDDIFLLDDSANETQEQGEQWKLLVVDDEPEVHHITSMTLSQFVFDNKSILFLHANSAQEAKRILAEHSDIALVLLDVVMETDDAGLCLVRHIRQELNNQSVRIVLRTGQPGQAPEDEVVENYDINDYKDKTELTSQKLRTLIRASLRSYRDICSLEKHKLGLEKVVKASRGIFEKNALFTFVEGALEQLAVILNLEDSCIYQVEQYAYQVNSTQLQLLAYQGQQRPSKAHQQLSEFPNAQQQIFSQAIDQKTNVFKDNALAIYCENSAYNLLFYITRNTPFNQADQHFINLLSENIVVALENIRLNEVISTNQKEVLYRLGEIVETRSKESGMHVRRVALFTALLAELLGLPAMKVEQLKLASPLHDVGKVAIPDAILHKPGKLTAEEWEVMQTHAAIGENMLKDSNIEVMQLASEIAGSHHEKWDGNGYPRGLKGEDIPISGRLTAIADVFDALGSIRCYKNAWDDQQIIKYLEEQRGKQFDPQLVDALLNNFAQFAQIRDKYQD
ncbi:HD domain-containing phosphohydrolase [Agarivorans aestuarii]|uniref:HD domain-containing phosphohydrolase n=1 Tax=Agarivorans aestuarii TaxID=1563703 RepID=UPI001C8095F1|nr:HD domain-containing phosphohydrolase [Agarivorans aestuarii]